MAEYNAGYDAGYYAAHREEIRARQAAYRAENHDRLLEQQRGRRAANRDLIKAQAKAWRARPENRSRAVERVTAWQAANPEKVKEYKRKWVVAHPEKGAQTQARRRARKVGAETLGPVDYAEIIQRDRWLCYLCGSKTPIPAGELHMDHAVALDKGGEHSTRNIRMSHALCNWKKNARDVTHQRYLL